MTSTSPSSPRGTGRGRLPLRSSTRSHSSSTTSTSPRGATSDRRRSPGCAARPFQRRALRRWLDPRTGGSQMNLHLKIWRQDGPDDAGHFEEFEARDINADMSFLEMLDVINEGLID